MMAPKWVSNVYTIKKDFPIPNLIKIYGESRREDLNNPKNIFGNDTDIPLNLKGGGNVLLTLVPTCEQKQGEERQ